VPRSSSAAPAPSAGAKTLVEAIREIDASLGYEEPISESDATRIARAASKRIEQALHWSRRPLPPSKKERRRDPGKGLRTDAADRPKPKPKPRAADGVARLTWNEATWNGPGITWGPEGADNTEKRKTA